MKFIKATNRAPEGVKSEEIAETIETSYLATSNISYEDISELVEDISELVKEYTPSSYVSYYTKYDPACNISNYSGKFGSIFIDELFDWKNRSE